MDCRVWEELLDDYLAGKLPPAQRRAAEEHLAACPDCRELLDTVRGNLGSLQAPVAEDLTDAILARTSGPACPRAEEQLCDLVSGALAAGEAQLVRAHLEHCRRCQALAVTLRWLLPELREMGEVRPDAAFTADVLRATAPLRRRAGQRAHIDLLKGHSHDCCSSLQHGALGVGSCHYPGRHVHITRGRDDG